MDSRPPAPEVAILADVFAVLKGRCERAGATGEYVVFRETATRVVIERFARPAVTAANDNPFSMATIKP